MSDERHEWTDKYGEKWFARPSCIDSPDHVAARCGDEILNLARQVRERDERIKLLENNLAATEGYGNGLYELCRENRERAESAERKLAEVDEAIRKICEARLILLDCDDECCEPFTNLPAVRRALEGK